MPSTRIPGRGKVRVVADQKPKRRSEVFFLRVRGAVGSSQTATLSPSVCRNGYFTSDQLVARGSLNREQQVNKL